MDDKKFNELMESVREADKIVGRHVSACHRLIESDPYYDKFVEAAMRYLESSARGEPRDPTELQRLGAAALERVYSRYFESLKKGGET